ncbi:MAG TPA: hypothetical protein VLA61_00330 [Ideonella sp.]|uniref:hypothetical protein n=1 Tax=Ideonella sp. TaxID=1929293 RepID=UPI002BFD29B2|nr:hypothetical protein [Ideonella sp.]HSI46695.1 hypothetical protein [Ideonella sp.]
MLRISGESLDVDAMVSECGLVAHRTWRKNEARLLKGKIHIDSGANFVASGADLDDFSGQVKEATEFLRNHSELVARMAAFPGVQTAVLDFGVSLQEGYVSQFCYLPTQLVQLAASASLALEISQYACSESDEV